MSEVTQEVNTPTETQSTSTQSNTTSAAPVSHNEMPSEKMLSQSEVNELVGRVKTAAKNEYYQKGRQEALEEARKQATSQQVSSAQPSSTVSEHSSQNSSQGFNREQLREAVTEELQQMHAKQQHEQDVTELVSKLEAARNKYSNIDEIITPLNLPELPPVIWKTAAKLDNAADVLVEMANNPHKLAQLLNLTRSPELVKKEFQKLSASLKQNEKADEQTKANKPLEPLQPSNMGMSNGKKPEDLQVSDWKKIHRR